MSAKIYVGKAKSITTNLEILSGRDGNPYAQIDNFKPAGGGGSAPSAPVNQTAPSDDLPF